MHDVHTIRLWDLALGGKLARDVDHDPYEVLDPPGQDELLALAAQVAAEKADADFQWLMSGARGRRVVCRLLDESGMRRSSLQPNAMQMAAQEGGKKLGYWILDQIERLCPSGYHTMMKEQNDARSSRSNTNN